MSEQSYGDVNDGGVGVGRSDDDGTAGDGRSEGFNTKSPAI